MGCNRKVKLLASEGFLECKGGLKREVRTQLYDMQHGVKTDLLIEKRNLSETCLILDRNISLPKR